MSKPLTSQELDVLLYMLKGNKAALKLALDIIWVGQLWDDLIDGDNPRSADEINTAFIKAFSAIPNNIYYATLPEPFKSQLNGLIISAAMQYRDSTVLEIGSQDERFTAFIIRNAVLSVIHYLISLAGDEEWIKENGPVFWRTFSLRGEYLNFVAEGHQHDEHELHA